MTIFTNKKYWVSVCEYSVWWELKEKNMKIKETNRTTTFAKAINTIWDLHYRVWSLRCIFVWFWYLLFGSSHVQFTFYPFPKWPAVPSFDVCVCVFFFKFGSLCTCMWLHYLVFFFLFFFSSFGIFQFHLNGLRVVCTSVINGTEWSWKTRSLIMKVSLDSTIRTRLWIWSVLNYCSFWTGKNS